MVERYRDDAIFEYENNANKVVAISNRDNIPDINESTGEAKTLVGKKLHRFGDLALREKPPKNIKKSKNKSLSNQLMETFTSNLNKKYNSLSEEKLNYYPKTKDTHSIYDDLLNIVREYFTDQSPSLIKSALSIIPLIFSCFSASLSDSIIIFIPFKFKLKPSSINAALLHKIGFSSFK